MCIEFHEIEIEIERELNTRFGNWHRILILFVSLLEYGKYVDRTIREWYDAMNCLWLPMCVCAHLLCAETVQHRWERCLKKKRKKIDEATSSVTSKKQHIEKSKMARKKIAHSLRAYVNVSRKFAIDQTWFLGVINDTTAHTTRRAGLLLAPQPAANHRANRVMNKKNSLFAACYSIRNQFGSLLHLGKWERVEEKRVYHLFN